MVNAFMIIMLSGSMMSIANASRMIKVNYIRTTNGLMIMIASHISRQMDVSVITNNGE